MKLLIPLISILGVTLAALSGPKSAFLGGLYKPTEPGSANRQYGVPFSTVENSLEQHLDNFDSQNDARFQQRYFMNGEHFQPNGALIIVLGGEWEITPWLLEDSLPALLAAQNAGYIFYLEHRFYGKSIPTSNVTTDNLKYLNVDQALADIAHFIHYVKSTYVTPGAEHSHVILVGSHYAGSLAVWFRQKYPHLAIGAWASSSPVLAKLDHHEYKELAGAVYRRYGGDACYNRIEAGFAEIEQLVAEGKNEELTDLFPVCKLIESTNDVRVFLNTIAEVFSFIIQVQDDLLLPVHDVCDRLVQSETPLEGIADIIKLLFRDVCLPATFNELVELYSGTELNSPATEFGQRQWVYQMCDHLGWYHSSDSDNQPFGNGFPVDLMVDVCQSVYGNRYSREVIEGNIERQNTAHGGLNPDVTNVLFTHGELDPWRSVGVQENDHYHNATVIIIQGATQSRDIRPFTLFDSPTVVEARFQILELLHYWIAHASGIEVVPI